MVNTITHYKLLNPTMFAWEIREKLIVDGICEPEYVLSLWYILSIWQNSSGVPSVSSINRIVRNRAHEVTPAGAIRQHNSGRAEGKRTEKRKHPLKSLHPESTLRLQSIDNRQNPHQVPPSGNTTLSGLCVTVQQRNNLAQDWNKPTLSCQIWPVNVQWNATQLH